MAYADREVCPDCRSRLAGASRCPACGLDLTTEAARRLWQALLSADAWLDEARTASPAPVADGPVAPEPVAAERAPVREDVGVPLPSHPPQDASVAPPPGARLSVGAVVLALGALCLLVAGVIFLTVTWGTLGVAGRAIVLLLVTLLAGGVGGALTRRGLRGSAEALWAVFLGLLTLDWFAARAEGLLGLDQVPSTPWSCLWAALVSGVGVLVVRLGRGRLGGRELVVPSVVAGVAPWVAAVSVAAEVGETLPLDVAIFWSAAAALGVLVAATLLLRRGGLRVGAVAAGIGAAAAATVAVVAAVVQALVHPTLPELVVQAHGVPLLLVAGVAAAVALAPSAWTWPVPVAVVAGVLAVTVLLVTPAEASWPGRGGLGVLAVLPALLTLPRRPDLRPSALRGVGAFLALAVVLGLLPFVGALLTALATSAGGAGAHELAHRVSPVPGSPGPWWLALLAAAGLAVWVLVAARRPAPSALRAEAQAVALAVGLVGLLAALATTRPPAVLLASALLLAAAVLTVLTRHRPVGWAAAGLTVAALAPFVALDAWSAAALVWPLAAGLLVVLGLLLAGLDRRLLDAASGTAAGWAVACVVPPLVLLDVADHVVALVLVAVGSLVVAATVLLGGGRPGSRGAEAGGALAVLVAVATGAVVSGPGWLALVLTVAGVVAAVLGLLARAWYRWPAAAFLGSAWVLRLVASDVEVVEAYTAPFAVVLLAVGVLALRDPRGPGSSRALAPGLALALVPSLPQALDDPTSLRALALGSVAALVLAVGVARRWRAPFVAGAAVLALVVLANLGPYAAALPRWVLIAVAGVVLLGTGVTWEDRVRDGRSVVRRIGAMR